MAITSLANFEGATTFTLSLNLKLPAYAVGRMKAGNIEVKCTSGVVGTFALEASNSGDNWFEVSNSEMDADDNGLMWNIVNINYNFVRVAYTGASTNTGNMYARFRRETDNL
jgi:hypothetical protein